MGSKTLVVGATGLVGRDVVESLLYRGVWVKAASRKGTEVPGAQPTIFDLEKSATFETALSDVERVFLLIPGEALIKADEVVPKFVTSLKDGRVRKIVCMTGITSDRADSPMKNIEIAVKDSGIPYTLLRPNWFNQNFAPGFYLDSINRSDNLSLPVEDAKLSFVDTRDIGAVAAATLTEDGHDCKEYTLTGPDALDHKEACAILSRATGREIRYIAITDDAMRSALQTRGLPPHSIDIMERLYKLTREGNCALITNDVESVLGRPPTPFSKYADDHAELFRKRQPVG